MHFHLLQIIPTGVDDLIHTLTLLVLLPLSKSTPLNTGASIHTVFDTLDKKTLNYVTKDVKNIVKTVKPAIKALKHVAGLGLSYQGIHMEDVDLITKRDERGNILDAPTP